MRPDRIVVGEVRGEEAFDMLQAMNTGHEGSLTTVHAKLPIETLWPGWESMVPWPTSIFPSAPCGSKSHPRYMRWCRSRVSPMEPAGDHSFPRSTGMEGEVISMQDILSSNYGIDESGK